MTRHDVAVTFDESTAAVADPERSRIEDPAGSWVRTRPPGSWARLARCQGERPERWVAPTSRQEVAGAVAVCRLCPVRDLCRSYAQLAKCSGVWGGQLLSDGKPTRQVTSRAG